MEKVTAEFLKDYLLECFAVDPEVSRLKELVEGLEGAEMKATYEQMRKACEALVDEGILQPAGREGFEATPDYLEEYGHALSEPGK